MCVCAFTYLNIYIVVHLFVHLRTYLAIKSIDIPLPFPPKGAFSIGKKESPDALKQVSFPVSKPQ